MERTNGRIGGYRRCQCRFLNLNHERMTVYNAMPSGLRTLGGGGECVVGEERTPLASALGFASVPARKIPPNIFGGSLPRHLVLDANCQPTLPWETATPDRECRPLFSGEVPI